MYYYRLYNEHEMKNKQVSLGLLNDWVKKGNLNQRSVEDLPTIEYRIEYYSIFRQNANYIFDFKVIFSIAMDT